MSKAKKPNQQLKFSVVLLGLFAVFVIFNMMSSQSRDDRVLEFSDFIAKVESGEVTKATFKQDEIVVTGTDDTYRVYVTSPDSDLRQQLISKGVRVSYEPVAENSFWKGLLINSLPLLLLLFLFSSS